ncbi:MAG: choice-of-anchor D domain-containing protein, partial [Candidatus Kapaibacterium sp.]
MNPRPLFFAVMAMALAMFAAPYSTAQTRIDMPDGEAVVAVNILKTSAMPAEYSRLAATRGRIYGSKNAGGFWTSNAQLFEVPYSRRIIDMALKSGETGNTRRLAVLLDNGDAVVMEYDIAKNTVAANAVYLPTPFVPQGGGGGGFNQQTYKKILFGAGLTVHFGNVAYGNPLDGSAYTLDTAGLNRASIQDIASDGQGTVYAGTNRGILQWNTSTSRWSRVSGFDSSLTASALYICRDGRMLATVANRGVYLSTNNGANWALDTAGSGNTAFARFSDDAANNVYAVSNPSNSTSNLYRKTGTSAGWSRIDSTLSLNIGGVVRINDLSGELSLELGTTVGAMSSNKSGDDWSNTTMGIAAEDIYGLQYFPGDVTVVSTALGVYRKTTNWSRVFPATGFNGTRPLFRSTGNPESISFQLAGAGSGATARQGSVYTSTDQGATWSLDTTGLSAVPGSTSNQVPSVFGVDNTGKKYIATGVPITVYSTPWAPDTAGFYQPTGSSAASLIYTDPANTTYVSGAVYGGGGGGGFTVRDIVLNRRTAGATAWSVDTTGLNKRPVYSLAATSSLTYAGTGLVNGVSFLYKRGASGWTEIPAPPSAVSDARALAIDSTKSLYVAYSGVLSTASPNRGVYATSDDGATWDYAGLDSLLVRGLVATKDGVYAFTTRGGFKLTRQSLKSASIQFSKNVIDFGMVDVGSRKDTVITVTNNGNDTLRVSNLRVFSQSFTATPSQFSVAPGGSAQVTLSFRPTAGGPLSTTMRSVANTTPDTVQLIGQGKAADVKIVVESRSIDLGIVDVGAQRDSVISIANGGKDTMIVSGVNASVQGLSIIPSSFRLAGGDSTKITIRFAPTTAGSVIGYLRFSYNGPSDSIR